MNNILKFHGILDEVSKESLLLIGETKTEFLTKSEDFCAELQDSKYIKVPLVGVFNAGKSSLLNMFTQKPGMLPIDTVPETAVAYELYYDTNERVELYRNGSLLDTKSLAEIKELNTNPGDIAKVFCDSSTVKEVQDKGIILVDMPGIGSGIERHDAAIFNYINSGTAFVLVVDVEQGSLRGSTLAFIRELNTYDLSPAVLVSKTDKKPKSDVEDIVEYIRYQMTKSSNKPPFVSTVCSANNDLNGLEKFLSNLDANALAGEKMGQKLKSLINLVISQLKVRVELRTKDIADADRKLKLIEEEIEKAKTELPTSNSNVDTPEKSTQDILDNVKAVLEEKAGDIAQMIVDKEDQETIKSFIIGVVRAEIIASLKEESEQYSSALGVAVQDAVRNITTIQIDTNFLEDYAELIDIVMTGLSKFVESSGVWGKILQVILPFLPSVLNWLLGKSESEVVEEVRQKVIAQCVDKVTEELRPTLLRITIDNQTRIHQKIQDELVSRMERLKEGMREKLADASKSKEEVQNELSQLNAAVTHLSSLIERI